MVHDSSFANKTLSVKTKDSKRWLTWLILQCYLMRLWLTHVTWFPKSSLFTNPSHCDSSNIPLVLWDDSYIFIKQPLFQLARMGFCCQTPKLKQTPQNKQKQKNAMIPQLCGAQRKLCQSTIRLCGNNCCWFIFHCAFNQGDNLKVNLPIFIRQKLLYKAETVLQSHIGKSISWWHLDLPQTEILV